MTSMTARAKDTLWKALRHYGAHDDAGCLRRLLADTPVPGAGRIDALLDELRSSPDLLATVDADGARQFDGDPHTSATVRLDRRLALDGTGRGRALLLYVTARLLEPAVVVETGCFTGWDSAVLLQALDRNGGGHLYSIDVPARDGRYSQRGARSSLPRGIAPGFLVPVTSRARWTLIYGDVRRELMPLLTRIAPVDLFLHDSDHTYPHMMWEYAAVAPHMRPGGIIASDDIAWNTAFWDFAAALGAPPVVHRNTPNVGALRIPHGGRR